MKYLVLLSLYISLLHVHVNSQNVSVETTYGTVQGTVIPFSGSQYNVFLGVPYAKPPVDSRRFKAPARPNQWQGVRDATQAPAICPQRPDDEDDSDVTPSNTTTSTSGVSYTGSEDCLYLNVYVPGDILDYNADLLFPVIVFIHGGAFTYGSALRYDAGHLVMQSTAVVVVIQYRLGVLGFATSGGDGHIPSNLGLLDQVLALQWVHENIAAFGGNASRVTLMGESAGATSVLLHAVGPLSRDHFQAAIVQSAINMWEYPHQDRYDGAFKAALSELGCGDDDVITCAQNMPLSDLLTLVDEGFVQVVIDDHFLTEQPRDSFTSGNFQQADYMLGFNNDEMGWLINTVSDGVTAGISDDDVIHDFLFNALSLSVERDFEKGLGAEFFDTDDVSIVYEGRELANGDSLLAILREKYTDDDDAITTARLLLDAQRDSLFATFSVWLALQLQASNQEVYFYTFNHRSGFIDSNTPGSVQLGAPHEHELEYLFRYTVASGDAVFTDEEEELSRSMVTAWTSFAISGYV